MFLPGLVEYTKKKKIALIVMGAGNSKLTPAASAIADNVIFCWRSQIKNGLEDSNGKNSTIYNPKSLDTTIDNQSPNKILPILCLYVDRCQGQLGNEGKELSFLPIDDERGIKINCPRNLKKDNKYSSTGFNKVDDYSRIDDAKRTINTIIDMQGMGTVNK